MSKRIKLSGGLMTILALAVTSVALAAPKSPTITVTDNGTGLAASSTSPTSFSSHFTASGCGFKANDSNYELVVRGPGLYTSSVTYWVDAFPVGSNGCGSASPSWTSSGVSGNFDVYVVRSPSGNVAQAQPASNVVSLYVSS
jgi:hypothetical protein